MRCKQIACTPWNAQLAANSDAADLHAQHLSTRGCSNTSFGGDNRSSLTGPCKHGLSVNAVRGLHISVEHIRNTVVRHVLEGGGRER